MNLSVAFRKFEEKFKDISIIDRNWYRENCGVYAFCKEAKVIGSNKLHTEEWYRARMVWSMVESKMFPKENICVEFVIPKGSDGAKSLNPDIVVFKNKEWIKDYNSWDKKSVLPEKIAKNLLVVLEAKDSPTKVVNAVTKQMGEAMNSYVGERVFGAYFDNLDDPILFKKEGTNSIKRYNSEKIIDGEDFVEKLNLDNRDSLNDFPSFETYINNIEGTNNVSKLNFGTNDSIDEDTFNGLLEFMNREVDKLSLSRNEQDLIVEFLTLKVADEKEVKKGTKKYFDFYVLEDELNNGFGSQKFRDRISKLYARAKKEYKSIFNPPAFWYNSSENGNVLTPSHADDERFLLGLIEVFQKKTILETTNTSFNQIIFNNFGSNIEKAKEKQFFTPVPIVESIVKIINPQKEETICDPCSGICDFLAMAFRHIYKNELGNLPSADKFYGFDKDNKILKLAELNLVLNGDGNAQIKIMDSLSNKLLVDGSYKNINFNTDNYSPLDWKNLNDANKDVLKYDVILTNPPFGKGRDLKTGKDGKWDIKKKVIELYETWAIQEQPKSIDMGVLFLENAYKLLNEGGRMAIVLSNSIASIDAWKKVREWFVSKMRLVCLFNLPANSFGETGVATTVFVAYKPKANEKHILNENYEVFIKEINDVGYTVKVKDRVIIMSPDFIINEDTFEREKDSKGNDKRRSDLPELVNEFGKWLEKNKHRYNEIFEAFSGSNYQRWE